MTGTFRVLLTRRRSRRRADLVCAPLRSPTLTRSFRSSSPRGCSAKRATLKRSTPSTTRSTPTIRRWSLRARKGKVRAALRIARVQRRPARRRDAQGRRRAPIPRRRALRGFALGDGPLRRGGRAVPRGARAQPGSSRARLGVARSLATRSRLRRGAGGGAHGARRRPARFPDPRHARRHLRAVEPLRGGGQRLHRLQGAAAARRKSHRPSSREAQITFLRSFKGRTPLAIARRRGRRGAHGAVPARRRTRCWCAA